MCPATPQQTRLGQPLHIPDLGHWVDRASLSGSIIQISHFQLSTILPRLITAHFPESPVPSYSAGFLPRSLSCPGQVGTDASGQANPAETLHLLGKCSSSSARGGVVKRTASVRSPRAAPAGLPNTQGVDTHQATSRPPPGCSTAAANCSGCQSGLPTPCCPEEVFHLVPCVH